MYTQSNGAEGHIWNGVPCLLLTTKGRRSVTLQTLPVIYGMDGDSYLIVASKSGAAAHPAWYLNLCATSTFGLQMGVERFAAVARTASAAAKAQLWPIMARVWPAYDEYQTRTPRNIPVVVLARTHK